MHDALTTPKQVGWSIPAKDGEGTFLDPEWNSPEVKEELVERTGSFLARAPTKNAAVYSAGTKDDQCWSQGRSRWSATTHRSHFICLTRTRASGTAAVRGANLDPGASSPFELPADAGCLLAWFLLVGSTIARPIFFCALAGWPPSARLSMREGQDGRATCRPSCLPAYGMTSVFGHVDDLRMGGFRAGREGPVRAMDAIERFAADVCTRRSRNPLSVDPQPAR